MFRLLGSLIRLLVSRASLRDIALENLALLVCGKGMNLLPKEYAEDSPGVIVPPCLRVIRVAGLRKLSAWDHLSAPV